MDNLGKAIIMAGSTFLFLFAASTSIYLYGTLSEYLMHSNSYINISYRAEASNTTANTSNKRIAKIDEIYMILYNKDRFFVKEIIVDGRKVDCNNAEDLDFLSRRKEYSFLCVSTGDTVTYTHVQQ